MRIIGGKFKGRGITTPTGRTTRPTQDRTREALFNILEHADWSPGLEGCRVLDLFAGSGAFGFEALSREGAFALFVETDAAARGAIRQTIEDLGLFGVTRIHRRDATDLGAKPAGLGARFDLVFLDPPYGQGLGRTALVRLLTGNWVEPGALVVWELGTADQDAIPDGYTLIDTRTYGPAEIRFLKVQGAPAGSPEPVATQDD